ncbi:MAG TPA: nuclear transport factor 2 family protein [Phycisphaerales bacterium]|nr:nuclear transport factor 2 family protein [Phycisphaerales bacterium]
MSLTPEDAQLFADRWLAAWNAGDLDAIMSCYHPEVVHSSPFIAKFNGTAEDALHGIEAVRAYFGRALVQNPTPAGVTRFALMHTAVGRGSVILVYRRMTGELAAEIFHLDDRLRITRSISHYGPRG